MATSLQLQLMADVAGPLLNALQFNGLAVTSISLDSLDVQEVCACVCVLALSTALVHTVFAMETRQPLFLLSCSLLPCTVLP